MIVHLFLGIIAIISFVSVSSQNAISAEFVNGIVELSDRLTDGTPIKVKVQKMNLSPDYPYKHAFMWGGDMRGEGEVLMPKTAISAMDVRIGKEKILVPLSAYSDLGNPYQVSLEKADRRFKLIIAGRGGTATSYKAVLEFDDENIQRRKVTLSVFPDEVWEETVYSFIRKNDKR